MRIDLNADVGESFGAYTVGHDRGLMRSITSASISAGFHAGDPSVLRETIRLAVAHGVAVGAHPGFPDLAGFGRRALTVSAREAEDFILYQIAAVAGVAAAEGARLRHVKAHGALYTMAAADTELAQALARAVAAFDRSLILFVLPRSEMERAAGRLGLHVAREAFADRAYEPDGRLMDRQKAGSILHDATLVVDRAVRLATEGTVAAVDGSTLRVDAGTICVHGDTPGADQLAARIRSGLEAAGVRVQAIGDR
ncbi:MAG TPA: 5-oxoprolinase subunit PxpA [Candidatus Limnocylindrales bacterium]|nr:5-oxoprolinase subunit PxpA [Candidatus Limnocylindrales bacterium]